MIGLALESIDNVNNQDRDEFPFFFDHLKVVMWSLTITLLIKISQSCSTFKPKYKYHPLWPILTGCCQEVPLYSKRGRQNSGRCWQVDGYLEVVVCSGSTFIDLTIITKSITFLLPTKWSIYNSVVLVRQFIRRFILWYSY